MFMIYLLLFLFGIFFYQFILPYLESIIAYLLNKIELYKSKDNIEIQKNNINTQALIDEYENNNEIEKTKRQIGFFVNKKGENDQNDETCN